MLMTLTGENQPGSDLRAQDDRCENVADQFAAGLQL